MFLGRHRLGAKAAAVVDDVLCVPEESRMPMEVDLTIFLVPLSVEQQIFGVQELLDFLRMIFGTVGNREGIWHYQ